MVVLPGGLALNTVARIECAGDGRETHFVVTAPIRGTALVTHVVAPQNWPAAHGFLVSSLLAGRTDLQVDEQSLEQLRQIGLFAPVDRLPDAVTYPFPTGKSESPGFDLAASGWPNRPEALKLPEEWLGLPLQFTPHGFGGLLAPTVGQDGPSAPLGATIAQRMDTPETCALFAEEGFAELPELLPADHVAALGSYFQTLAREGYLERHDDRGTHRHIAHNHPVSNFWHEQLTHRISHLVGRQVKPSYTYVSLYIEGGDLEWHTDRPPCEYTITLLLDYAPLDDDGQSPWALKVQARDGTIREFHQRPGDALIFKGRELRHSRDALPTGHRSASLLFHFVDFDYQGTMV